MYGGMQMTLIGVAAIVMAIAMVAVAAYLIPALIELRKTVVATREFLERTESELKPLITEIHEAVVDLKILTATVSAGSENLKDLFEVAGETGRGLRTISSLVNGVTSVVSGSSLWLTGAKVASKFILERLKNRKQQRKGGADHGE
jgi:uncharacterized protein YoxC